MSIKTVVIFLYFGSWFRSQILLLEALSAYENRNENYLLKKKSNKFWHSVKFATTHTCSDLPRSHACFRWHKFYIHTYVNHQHTTWKDLDNSLSHWGRQLLYNSPIQKNNFSPHKKYLTDWRVLMLHSVSCRAYKQ